MTSLAAAAAIGGSLISGFGAVASGISQSNALKAQAAAAEAQGMEEQAASQRDAIQKQKEAQLVLSRQQAVSAASGGTATDSSVLNLVGDTAAQGQYNVASSIYAGNAAAAAANDQAAIYRMQAKQSMLGGFINAGSTLLSGFSQYSRYKQYDSYYGSNLPTLPATTYSGYRAGL